MGKLVMWRFFSAVMALLLVLPIGVMVVMKGPALADNPPAATTLPAPVIVEKVTSYKSQKFTNDKLSIAYPDGWTVKTSPVPGVVFHAKNTGKDNLFVAIRPATVFKDAALTLLADLITASGASFSTSVGSGYTVTLADGTVADVILVSADFGMAKAAITGVVKNGNAIIVVGAADPNSVDLYKEIGSTLIVTNLPMPTPIPIPAPMPTPTPIPILTPMPTPTPIPTPTPTPEPSYILKSGTYSVIVIDGATAYTPTWTLQVTGNQITGQSQWNCCPGPRTDPLQGRIEGNRVIIERDCTGQGRNGECLQVYDGMLTEITIVGQYTLNGSYVGPWKLYLGEGYTPTIKGPTINSFAISPSSTLAGSAVLNWSVSNATSVTIDNGVGSVSSSGSRTVNPATTTTYTLLASNGSNTVTQSMTVNVKPTTTTAPYPTPTTAPYPTPTSVPTPTLIPATIPNPTTGMVLIAESMTATPNSVIKVPIRIKGASNIGSMNFVLTYDAQVLKVNRVETGPLLTGALFTPNYQTPPLVRFGLATSGGITGSGTMAYIEFQVIGADGSSSPLAFSKLSTRDASGGLVAVTNRDGTVTVATSGGKVKGDFNGDGKITEIDGLAALKMSIMLLPEDLILDMDGDGAVTAEDARLMLNISVGR